MTERATATWLLKIAHGLEDWPTTHRDDAARAIDTSTPIGALPYVIIEQHIPKNKLDAVVAGLPTMVTDDFGEAAKQIRQLAERSH
jgi:hypothetical protein